MAKKLYLKEIDILIAKATNKTEREILRQYKRSIREINDELLRTYNKYADSDGILTRSQMFKYNRYKVLQKNIFDEIGKISDLNKEEINKLSTLAYTEAHSLTFSITASNIVTGSFVYAKPVPSVVKASVQNSIDKLTLNQRLSKQSVEVKRKIRNELTQGLIKGESYQQMSKRITTTLEGDSKKSIRVARTEAHRNQITGRLESMKELATQGAKIKKEWLAVGDKRTRTEHNQVNSQQVPVNGMFNVAGHLGPAPGMFGVAYLDINCRCVIIVVIV